MNIKIVNRVLSIILICQIAFLIIITLYCHLVSITQRDAQREAVLAYIEEERFMGMTAEECKDVFGIPLYERDGMMCFDGGSECNTAFFIKIYEEYEFDIYFDENGKADSTSEWCTLSVMY